MQKLLHFSKFFCGMAQQETFSLQKKQSIKSNRDFFLNHGRIEFFKDLFSAQIIKLDKIYWRKLNGHDMKKTFQKISSAQLKIDFC